MTKNEREQIRKVIGLINSDNHWEDGMDILFELIGERKPTEMLYSGKGVSIEEFIKKTAISGNKRNG
mgnify:CR=1 FL=1